MTVAALTLSVALLLGFYVAIKPALRRIGPFLPDSVLFGIALYTTGAMFLTASSHGPVAAELATMSLLAMASAVVGAILFALACGSFYRGVHFMRQYAVPDAGPIERLFIKVILVFSGAVCIAFVYAVFSNSILAALLSIASLASDETLLDARKAITSGAEGYFAPGYVKQFRDILIPIALIAAASLGPDYRRRPVVWFAFLSGIGAMLVSGQRLVFVVLFLALMLGNFCIRQCSVPESRVKARGAGLPWLAILALLALYGLLTLLLGRINFEVSPPGVVADIFVNLADRIVLAAPRENMLTYPAWEPLGPTGGASWLADLGAVMPGANESLANILHAATGGSLLGNSPLGLPPDVWLAWGWPGLLLVPGLFVFLIGMLDMLLLTNRSPLLFATRIYLFVVLPICYSPYLFVLYGGAAAILLMLAMVLLRSRPWWAAESTPA